ncbi:MAG: hypothetical protein WC351_05970, partial [Candidatus Izemoplasmatales bacterium]
MILSVSNTDIEVLLNDEMIALIVYCLMYLSYYFCSDFPFIKRFRSRFQESKDHFEASVYIRRTLGFILLGVIPLGVA